MADGRWDSRNLGGFGSVTKEELILNATFGFSFRSDLAGIEAIGMEEARFDIVGQIGGDDHVDKLTT